MMILERGALGNSGQRHLRRVRDYRAFHPGKRGQRVYLEVSRANDFLGAGAMNEQRVGDQRTMAFTAFLEKRAPKFEGQ